MSVVDQAIGRYPDVRRLLEVHKTILNIQKGVREDPHKGTSVNWSNRTEITNLQRKAIAMRRPIASFIDFSIFDTVSLRITAKRLTTLLVEQGFDRKEMEKLAEGIECRQKTISELAAGALGERVECLEEVSSRWGISPKILLLIADILIQPCLEAISLNVDPGFLEKWGQAECPVCGRRPIIAWLKSRKRYLACTLCGAEYAVDLFLCVNCGNVDPTDLKFLAPDDKPEFRVDFCEKCRHYVKVIDMDRLKTPIPRGLEDIITLDLDLIAKNAGLNRLYFV